MTPRRLFLPCLLASLATLSAQAARHPFDPVKDVGIALSHGAIILTVPPGVHLKQRFFKVELASVPGTVTVGLLPPADGKDDAGDPVWHGTLRVPLTGTGLKDPVVLRITYQPCTEGEDSVCYLPQHRLLPVTVAGMR